MPSQGNPSGPPTQTLRAGTLEPQSVAEDHRLSIAQREHVADLPAEGPDERAGLRLDDVRLPLGDDHRLIASAKNGERGAVAVDARLEVSDPLLSARARELDDESLRVHPHARDVETHGRLARAGQCGEAGRSKRGAFESLIFRSSNWPARRRLVPRPAVGDPFLPMALNPFWQTVLVPELAAATRADVEGRALPIHPPNGFVLAKSADAAVHLPAGAGVAHLDPCAAPTTGTASQTASEP